jgi:hypothetical protein
MTTPKEAEAKRANRDPITDAPGAHPVGVGVGAASAGLAGAAIGALAGPIGAVAGAAIGAVAGGLAGKATAEVVDPTVEDAYWRYNFKSRPYYVDGVLFDDYLPAYRYGYTTAQQYPGRAWEETSADVEAGWTKAKDKSSLTWESAKHASRDAWNRVNSRK